MRTAQRAVSRIIIFLLSSRRTPLSKRLKQAKAQRTSVWEAIGRSCVSSKFAYTSKTLQKKSEAKRKNILTFSQAPNCSTGVDYKRGLTELLKKEKKARLVWARSLVNYKFKTAFSTTFCTKNVNETLANENCAKTVGNRKKEQDRSIYSVSYLINKSLRIASCSISWSLQVRTPTHYIWALNLYGSPNGLYVSMDGLDSLLLINCVHILTEIMLILWSFFTVF